MTNHSLEGLKSFLLIARLEGISYLLLLGIAMPMKYWTGIPEPVKYVGWAHGLLFILYVLLLLQVWIKFKWKFLFVTWAFVASLLPFGTFILESGLKKRAEL
ncbi:MAG: DUF3817 domain-containing protein [Cytophagaceae bacterium]